MMKLLLHLLVNYFGFSLLLIIFGWPLYCCPGRSTLYELERATGTDQQLHFMCWDSSSWPRQLFVEQITSIDQAALERQKTLAGTLLATAPQEKFVPWTRAEVAYNPASNPILLATTAVLYVGFLGLLMWGDPVGRLWRSRGRRRQLAVFCLCLPGMTALPNFWRHERLCSEIGAVVQQRYELLWREQPSGRGLVVILHERPAEVAAELSARLHLGSRDQLAVTYHRPKREGQLPPNMGYAWALELLACSWLVHRWTVRKGGIWT